MGKHKGYSQPSNPWDDVPLVHGKLQGMLTDELALHALPYQEKGKTSRTPVARSSRIRIGKNK